MFNYSQFDNAPQNNRNKMSIITLIILIILVIISIIIVIIDITPNNEIKIIASNSRQIINDLSNLNNYTETMSDYMISNDNNNNNNNNNNELYSISEKQLEEIRKIRLSIEYLQEEKRLKEEEDKQKEIKENVINLIKSYIPNYDSQFKLVTNHSQTNGYSNINSLNQECLKELIEINNEELFNKLIDIDYNKSTVSFNYLDKNPKKILTSHLYGKYDKNNKYYNRSVYIYENYKENIIQNPIYQTIKEKLEFDYDYKIEDIYNEYNDKSKYFSESNKAYLEMINNNNIFHYYETYSNDTNYSYYKLTNNYYFEIVKLNKIIINNQTINNNKHPYKNICNNFIPIITSYYDFIINGYYNDNLIYKNNLENILNFDYKDYNYDDCYYYNNIYKCYHGNYWFHNYYNNRFFDEVYELEKTRGSRMVKNKLLENIESSYINHEIYIYNYYFIKKVIIDFPLIYDEYDYIKLLIKDIANIYDLPIIPPIKFKDLIDM